MQNKIAVIGMSFQYPYLHTPEEFAAHLSKGTFLSNDGWKERGALLHLPDYQKIIGKVPLITGIEYFDHKFFGITQKEAMEMTPEMKLALTHAALAVYDAGYSLQELRGRDCGMVLASSSTAADYRNLTSKGNTVAYLNTRESMIGGKLSYYFDLNGPIFSVDSTCSSSLLAVTQAADVLNSGQADWMLAGGVQLFLPQDEKRAHELLLGIECAKSDYIPFDEAADGLILGEGAGFVLLKRYEDAVRDRDSIYGVISGYGLSGTRYAHRASPYAPDGASQSRAIVRAWKMAGITADDITEIEAHGSATELGDQNEVEGLRIALQDRKKETDVLLSSVKSNIGHTAQAAGITGLVKVLVGFSTNTAYPMANFQAPKKSIDYADAHLKPLGTLHHFDPAEKRVAGINSYGLNALNVHVVMEQYRNPETTAGALDPLNHVLKLSAKTESAFAAYVQALAAALEQENENLNDLIYTLNTGRDDFRYRAAVTFEDRETLRQALQTVACQDFGETEEEALVSVYSKEVQAQYPDQQDAASLAAVLLRAGRKVDFADYYQATAFRRIHTVPYQFDPIYNWIWEKQELEEEASPAAETAGISKQEVHDTLKQIWQQVLESEEDIPDEDSFFELGGNSMVASLLIESVNDKFDCGFEFSDIYTYNTLAQMTDFVLEKCGNGAASEEPAATPEPDAAETKRAEVHDTLKQIWQQVLESEEDIPDEDSFFELGGNSMVASLLIESVNDKFDCGFEFSDIYTYNTLAQMTDFVLEKCGNGAASEEPAATPEPDAAETKRAEVHDTLKQIWQQVLESEEDIPDEDSFFELGGNSMVASLLIESVNDKFDCEFEFSDIYTYNTLAQMTDFVVEAMKKGEQHE